MAPRLSKNYGRFQKSSNPKPIDVREIQCRGAACCARSSKAFAVSENNTIFCGYQQELTLSRRRSATGPGEAQRAADVHAALSVEAPASNPYQGEGSQVAMSPNSQEASSRKSLTVASGRGAESS